MIKIEMTVREMLNIIALQGTSGDLADRIISALEVATGNDKLLVACNGAHCDGKYWDQKIPAIKALRLATGMGLKDAKDWIEEAVNYHKAMFTKPLDFEVAHRLCDELARCGCSCWTANS